MLTKHSTNLIKLPKLFFYNFSQRPINHREFDYVNNNNISKKIN
jgi:hypothetical protein